MIAIFSHHLNK